MKPCFLHLQSLESSKNRVHSDSTNQNGIHSEASRRQRRTPLDGCTFLLTGVMGADVDGF
ncbi:hypothetical protein [Roseimaritima multifibrata]|nr:hypothetical protein [Roseimaritima multifibrata]